MRHWVSVFFLISLFTPSFAIAQRYTLSGQVTDADSKQPVPFASIFFSNTTIGAVADQNGQFILNNIPAGKYDLLVSSVGFIQMTLPIDIQKNIEHLDIKLKVNTQLGEIVVRAHKSKWKEHLAEFKKYFLGTGINALKCSIKNEEDLDFIDDKATRVFAAFASKPLEIENKALGYRIVYILKEFKIDYQSGLCYISGLPVFIDLVPKNGKQKMRWQDARDRTYFGSINHFMRSLQAGKLTENKFAIFLFSKPKHEVPGEQRIHINDVHYYAHEITKEELFARDPFEKFVLGISFKYKKRNEIADLASGEVSFLKVTVHNLVIYDNGYFEDPLTYVFDGVMSNKVGDLVPMNYEPSPSRSR